MSDLIVVILAGGVGKRMNSNLPKVLHLVANKPMLVKIIEEAQALLPNKILIVVGKYYPIIKTTIETYLPADFIKKNIDYIHQEEPLGTGHALQCGIPFFQDETANILVLSGDVPLLRTETMKKIIAADADGDGNGNSNSNRNSNRDSGVSAQNNKHAHITVTNLDNPTGYGRIIKNHETKKFDRIVEEKDCSDQERKVATVNCGIYYFSASLLCKYLPLLKNDNSQKEYYLTDIVGILSNEGYDITMVEISKENQFEILGVNTEEQLKELNTYIFL